MFSSYIITAFSGSWTSRSFSKDPKPSYKHFQHMAKCKIAPEKKADPVCSLPPWILQPAHVVWWLVPSPWMPKGDEGCASAKDFWISCRRSQHASSALPYFWVLIIQAQIHGLWHLRQSPTLLHQNQRASPPTATMGQWTHKRSCFSCYKCTFAFLSPPPGTSLMVH